MLNYIKISYLGVKKSNTKISLFQYHVAKGWCIGRSQDSVRSVPWEHIKVGTT